MLFITTFILHFFLISFAVAQKFTFTNGQQQNSINFIKIKNLIVIPIFINESVLKIFAV